MKCGLWCVHTHVHTYILTQRALSKRKKPYSIFQQAKQTQKASTARPTTSQVFVDDGMAPASTSTSTNNDHHHYHHIVVTVVVVRMHVRLYQRKVTQYPYPFQKKREERTPSTIPFPRHAHLPFLLCSITIDDDHSIPIHPFRRRQTKTNTKSRITIRQTN